VLKGCYLPCVADVLPLDRAEFETLLAENAAKPEAERLPRSAFEIDVGLREMVGGLVYCMWLTWVEFYKLSSANGTVRWSMQNLCRLSLFTAHQDRPAMHSLCITTRFPSTCLLMTE
jgi:hypothetical protein